MKKIMTILAMLLSVAVSVQAMSYRQAREQALFLTDKMAYELNLTDDQYEAAYEINLDYLMSIESYDDLYGAYWRQRNIDLGYILLDWQYQTYCRANYFYRPLYWNDGYWHFSVYARYPHRDYFYFGRPTFFGVYCGDHSWRMNGGRSWYSGRTFGPRRTNRYIGMRDGFDRGDFGRGSVMIINSGNTQFVRYENARNYPRYNTQSANRSFGEGNRNIDRPRSFGGGNRDIDRPRSFGNGSNQTARSRSFGQESSGNNRVRSFGQSSTRTTVGYGANTAQREFGNMETRRSFGGNTNSRTSGTSGGGHFGNSSEQKTPARSFGSSTHSFGGFGNNTTSRSFGNGAGNGSTRSFGGGSSTPTRSFGGGSSAPTRSFGGGGNSTGGGHFGGRK